MKKKLLVGVDEVGRGCLAGPVWASAFAWRDSAVQVEGLKDSKKLSPKKREALVPPLQERGWFGHGVIAAEDIDRMGILRATFAAMRQAVVNLATQAGVAPGDLEVCVDGNLLPDWSDLGLGEMWCLVKADDLVPQVSAASVLAKVGRDQLMASLDAAHPGYGFGQHAGYGTAKHMAAIETLGATVLHRMSFAPLNKLPRAQGVAA